MGALQDRVRMEKFEFRDKMNKRTKERKKTEYRQQRDQTQHRLRPHTREARVLRLEINKMRTAACTLLSALCRHALGGPAAPSLGRKAMSNNLVGSTETTISTRFSRQGLTLAKSVPISQSVKSHTARKKQEQAHNNSGRTGQDRTGQYTTETPWIATKGHTPRSPPSEQGPQVPSQCRPEPASPEGRSGRAACRPYRFRHRSRRTSAGCPTPSQTRSC